MLRRLVPETMYLKHVIGRDVADVRGNGIGCPVVFEGENPKLRAGSHHLSLIYFEIEDAERRDNLNVAANCLDNHTNRNR